MRRLRIGQSIIVVATVARRWGFHALASVATGLNATVIVPTMVVGTDVLSRLVAVVGIGVVAGLGTGLIESVAKTGWMKVVQGLIAGKQFILYKNPTVIGSSPQCEIYLFKDVAVAPRHAAIRKLPAGYEMENLVTGGGTFVNGAQVHRTRLRNGDQVQIGSTVFLFQEKDKS